MGAPADRVALVDSDRDIVLRIYRAAFHATAPAFLAKVARGAPAARCAIPKSGLGEARTRRKISLRPAVILEVRHHRTLSLPLAAVHSLPPQRRS